MFKKKISAIIASILTITSCCLLFSACERDHFASLKDTAFVGEELTLNTYRKTGQATGTLTIGEKSYFVGYADFTGEFALYDLSNISELQGNEAHRWDWDVGGNIDYIEGERQITYILTLHSKYYNYDEEMPISIIWDGTYKDNSFPFYKSTTYVKLTIEQDYLSEREGTPSYAGKTIKLNRQK